MENLFASITSPTGVEVMAFVGSLFFLAAGANQVLKLVDRNKEQPPPSETYTTKVECGIKHEGFHDRLCRLELDVPIIRDEIRLETAEISRLAEARTSGLHERINDVLAAVSELRGVISRARKL